tara:strand:+ start:699 stop:926 length:228 start_codon:yes stop_codon:yes gene_type:complete
MRNIDVPGAKEIFAKQNKLLDTFWDNRGSDKAVMAIHDAVREDFFFDKMQNLRQANVYERAASAYYTKYGTVGEF